MSQRDRDLTACCGLYCGDCNRFRSRASDLARELLRELEHTMFDRYAEVQSHSWPELECYGECRDVLEAIVRLQCNEPCRVGGGCPTFSCEILKCCREKALEGCWQCNEFENCSRFEFLERYHGDAHLRNLRRIKEFGLDRWAEHRHKFYLWE